MESGSDPESLEVVNRKMDDNLTKLEVIWIPSIICLF